MSKRKSGDIEYKPLERPRRFPLELRDGWHGSLEICLWSENRQSCFVIAFWVSGWYEADLKFVSGRPLDNRVKWEHFRELIVQGQEIEDGKMYMKKEIY